MTLLFRNDKLGRCLENLKLKQIESRALCLPIDTFLLQVLRNSIRMCQEKCFTKALPDLLYQIRTSEQIEEIVCVSCRQIYVQTYAYVHSSNSTLKIFGAN